MVMLEGVPPATTQLVWDVNAGAFVAPRPDCVFRTKVTAVSGAT